MEAYHVLDTQLGKTGAYVAGHEYTIADIAIFPWLRSWKNQGIDWNDHPHLKGWFDEIGARPAQIEAAVALLDGGATVPFIASVVAVRLAERIEVPARAHAVAGAAVALLVDVEAELDVAHRFLAGADAFEEILPMLARAVGILARNHLRRAGARRHRHDR